MFALRLFIAKVIQLSQVIMLPLKPSFFDMAAGRTIQLKDVDQQLAKLLLYGFCEDVYDKFTITIDDDYEHEFDLVKDGSKIKVTEENFDIYQKALEDFIYGKHAQKKIDCFVNSFDEVALR